MNVVLIPLRYGSRRIHLKNFRRFNNKPLYQWVMEEAIICPKVDKVYAATTNLVKNIPSEKRELLSVVHIFERSHESESDDAPLEILLSEFTENVPYDNLVILQCTNPFTESKDIAEVFRLLSEYDSIVSVCRQKRFLWKDGKPLQERQTNQ